MIEMERKLCSIIAYLIIHKSKDNLHIITRLLNKFAYSVTELILSNQGGNGADVNSLNQLDSVGPMHITLM